MIDLERKSGLPILLDGEIIKPNEGLELPVPAFRKLEELAPVLLKGSELSGPEIVYSMFRKISKPEHREIFEKLNLEYDITVILAGNVGEEFIKTIGHYHSKKEGTDIYYPEIYEVIHGKAHYLIQKLEGDEVRDVRIIEAEEGDKVVIPPGYGHITINPGSETLVAANIQSTLITPDYIWYSKNRGGVFYESSNDEFVKNRNYENNFEPLLIKAKDINDVFEVKNDVPLYTDFISNPEKYDFLANPEKYLDKFGEIYN